MEVIGEGRKVKIIMSIAMSNSKKNAEHYVTVQLPQVLENLVKIWMFKTTPALVKEWSDEIEDKHMYGLCKVINNVKTDRGYLKPKVVAKVWTEVMRDSDVAHFFKANGRDPKYKKLVVEKSHTDLYNFSKSVLEFGPVFAKLIVGGSEDDVDGIVQKLVYLTGKKV